MELRRFATLCAACALAAAQAPALRLLDPDGLPVAGAVVEIRDARGARTAVMERLAIPRPTVTL